MNLDGSYNSQSEIFEKAFGFQQVALTASSVTRNPSPVFLALDGSKANQDIVSGRKRKKRDARDLIALGTLPPEGGNKNPNDLKIGIFIQRQDLRQHPIVEQAQRLAHGETRVIYTGKIVRRAINAGRCRPVLIGGSVGHQRVTAGTIGCVCRHRIGGGLGILFNNHVLADINKAQLGDIIIQPGRADGGRRSTDKIATLFSFVPIQFETGTRNLVDCAFATFLGDVDHSAGEIFDPHSAASWPISGDVEDLIERDTVLKVGRTTGLTKGTVSAIEVNNLTVAMVLGNGERLARFDGQIAIESKSEAFSAGGDSGSLIFSEAGAPAALLFAGSQKEGEGVTFANPIQTVFDALDIDLHIGT